MRQIITSLHNQRVKDAMKLRERRGRDRQGRIVIDGVREIRRANEAGVQWVEVFVCEPLCDSHAAPELIDRLEQRGANVCYVAPETYQKIAFGQRCEGLVAVALTPVHALDRLELDAGALIAVLEGVEKPGNLGAVIRSADGAGANAVILADCVTDLYNPNCIRASLGTIFCMALCSTTSREAIEWLRRQRATIYVARVDGDKNYSVVDYRGTTAVVLGSEATGLSDIWRQRDMQAITLPMKGAGDSMNVSTAAAVVLYEAARQRA